MKRVAQFYKVSRSQFIEGFHKHRPTKQNPENLYDEIKLPIRATIDSAGYDFFLPCDMRLSPGQTIMIPTGVRVRIESGWVLKLYPRSGLGFKYRLQFNNTVGIIDGDYYHSDNEGHIFIRMTNDSNEDKIIDLLSGTAFVQGIFVEYGVTYDDEVSAVRNGGLGSTG